MQAMRLSTMHHINHRGYAGVHWPSSTEELVQRIRSDFNALAAIMARYELQDDQLDCVVRAKAAIQRGIALSNFLSAAEQPDRAAFRQLGITPERVAR
jgi:hypothetical protein